METRLSPVVASPRRRPVALLATVVAAAVALGSCIPPTQYRTEPIVCSGDPETTCAAAFLEDHPEYLLGFVEFDDLGWAWTREQGRVLIEAIQRQVDERDVLMVVFAHGWKHRAWTCDNNVTCFRQTLSSLHDTEVALADRDRRPPRKIIGVYVGWRGLSSRGRLLTQTTFFGRKKTAHQVGSGAITELFVRLAQIRSQKHASIRRLQRESEERGEPERPVDSNTRLVIVGHSFGGALVFSATSQLMMERLAVGNVLPGPVRGLGDLVVLVNPAFEAARYQPLHASATGSEQSFGSDQKPVMAIITSRGDSATGKAFPLGRFFSARLDDYRRDAMGDEQRQANRAAIGHFEPYRTHFLDTNTNTPKPKAKGDSASECACPYSFPSTQAGMPEALSRLVSEREATNGATMTFPTATLRHDKYSPFTPLQVISVDEKIITSHNDIYQPAFIDFLRYYIMLSAGPGAS